MRLNKIDISKINKGKPNFLRLYDIHSVTDEELNFIGTGIFRYVNNVSASNCCKEINEALKLEFGIIHKDTPNLVIVEKTEWRIELYITTRCNLSCNSCGQFSQFKDTWVDMPMDMIDSFIEDNKDKSITVHILGGEPTVVKELDNIILKLSKYFNVTLATNGLIPYSPPIPICIENTNKPKGVMPIFTATMEAPKDLERYKDDDFSLGCFQENVCGYSFTTTGYYPCSMAGSVDRQLGLCLGSSSLEEAKARRGEIYSKLCGFCGTYKTKNYVHYDVPKGSTDQTISKSWDFMRYKK